MPVPLPAGLPDAQTAVSLIQKLQLDAIYDVLSGSGAGSSLLLIDTVADIQVSENFDHQREVSPASLTRQRAIGLTIVANGWTAGKANVAWFCQISNDGINWISHPQVSGNQFLPNPSGADGIEQRELRFDFAYLRYGYIGHVSAVDGNAIFQSSLP